MSDQDLDRSCIERMRAGKVETYKSSRFGTFAAESQKN